MHDLWWIIAIMLLMVVISILDIRKKKIHIGGLAALWMTIICMLVSEGDATLESISAGCVPGVVFMIFSLLTGGKVGMGDAILLITLGVGFGIVEISYISVIALILCCIWSGSLLILKKVNRSSCIAFAPFITIGLGVVSLAQI